ncbi:MAG: hypothetical protein LBI69_04590 [Puniceicoccales bacterium]|nr:hypothetical protein [Puniceicoccales bacterium]
MCNCLGFLHKTLSKKDLKRLCLTSELNGKVAILNFLCYQSGIDFRRKCLKFIGEIFDTGEKTIARR